MMGNTLPTPLYVLYQAKWHFSSGVVTLVFAAYAVGVVTALLFAGRSSDQVGRRPVLATALVFSATSAVAFILASGVGWLFAGRVLSGLSAGLVTGTGTATPHRHGRPLFGATSVDHGYGCGDRRTRARAPGGWILR